MTLVSNTGDTESTNDASGLDVVNSRVTTFATLKTLAVQYNVTDDDCAGGSPRFQIAFGDKNAFVYVGSAPSFTGCTQNRWVGTGNLLRSAAARFDLSKLGGAQNATYQQALQLLGSQTVTGISLVADSSWLFSDKEQTVLVRNVRVNASQTPSRTARPSAASRRASSAPATRRAAASSRSRAASQRRPTPHGRSSRSR